MSMLRKYPRTRHLEGSRSQTGDEDLDVVPLAALAGRHVAVEEKLDGANAGISFEASGRLQLQSRGHFLAGGGRERHFDLFKTWANARRGVLWERLRDRFVLYGEWLYAKHTVFYDRLPHYLLEFDILDTETGEFLSTEQRHRMLEGTPVVSVPVLSAGPLRTVEELQHLIGVSRFKSAEWKAHLQQACVSRGLDPQRAIAETDPSDLVEGLYLKTEQNGRVVDRYKFIRPSFLAAVADSETHWLNRPIVPNLLGDAVDLFGPS